MTVADTKLIAASVHRSGILPDKNKVRQMAREKMRHLIAVDIAANIQAQDPIFDIAGFMRDCGFIV